MNLNCKVEKGGGGIMNSQGINTNSACCKLLFFVCAIEKYIHTQVTLRYIFMKCVFAITLHVY